jgi:hypothetical protein
MPKCVNLGAQKLCIMKQFVKLSALAICIAFCGYFFACSGDELSPDIAKSVEQSTMLFNRISVTKDEMGDLSFLEDKSSIQPVVEKLFVEKNQLLTKVDDFGFVKDDLGLQYFFVREITDEKSKSIFVLLSGKDEISLREGGGGQSIPGTECENEHCCDECVVNNSKCVCHDQNDECQRNGETSFKCKEKNVSVSISVP